MDVGFDGSSLAVFTGLTPGGAIAFALLALVLLAILLRERLAGESPSASPRLRALDGATMRLRHLLALPLAVAWAGLVAAATHLGTPANALYAFSAVGSSPLSNEVACVVVFLFVSGVYWLYGFSRKPRFVVEVLLLVLGIASVAGLIIHTSTAYSVSTVPSWDNPLVPLNVAFAAGVAGFSLAFLVLGLAYRPSSIGLSGGVRMRALRAVLLTGAFASLFANAVSQTRYLGLLAALENNVVAAGALPAAYGMAVLLAGALAFAGMILQGFSLSSWASASRWRSTFLDAAGCVLVLVAAVLVRAPFYEVYLSVGF